MVYNVDVSELQFSDHEPAIQWCQKIIKQNWVGSRTEMRSVLHHLQMVSRTVVEIRILRATVMACCITSWKFGILELLKLLGVTEELGKDQREALFIAQKLTRHTRKSQLEFSRIKNSILNLVHGVETSGVVSRCRYEATESGFTFVGRSLISILVILKHLSAVLCEW